MVEKSRNGHLLEVRKNILLITTETEKMIFKGRRTYNVSEKKKREELRQKGPIWMRGTDTDKKGHLTRGIVIGKKDIGID